MSTHPNIIQTIENKVFKLFKEELPDGFVYHNYQHTRDTVEACQQIGEYYKLEKKEVEVLLLAAWLHHTGYTKCYENHENESESIAQQWLQQENYSSEGINKVRELIRSTHANHQPDNLLEEILHDADLIHTGQKNFFKKSELLRMEWERVRDKEYSNPEWHKNQTEFIVNTRFFTQYAATEYGARKDKNVEKQRNALKKSFSKQQKKKINKLKSRKLGRGIETMYRATYRNHINLSSIADAKANMMISLNTIIMSVIITVVGSGFVFGGKLFESIRFTVPITILLIGSLIAVIFAVISARPDVTQKEVDLEKIKKKKSSVLFFGNFSNLDLGNFISNLQELKADQDLLYDNMSIDIYYLGKVLTRKYKLLRMSYTIFITGLTCSVLSFLIIFFYTNR